ncbi:hypothetical protein A4A49_28229 [Nicotiana attenuata]|uniref:Senescence domain-containing protein n=1 Tax=Nicotiana attenuata TaxID=49451 RepID=A0A1J6ISH0_NICAT|nr:hypothetical protein A4A49_28229 [Nicotiana attenuata]
MNWLKGLFGELMEMILDKEDISNITEENLPNERSRNFIQVYAFSFSRLSFDSTTLALAFLIHNCGSQSATKKNFRKKLWGLLRLGNIISSAVDESIRKIDIRVPPMVKQASAAARSVAANVKSVGVIGAASGLAKTVYANYEPAAKGLYTNYEPMSNMQHQLGSL